MIPSIPPILYNLSTFRPFTESVCLYARHLAHARIKQRYMSGGGRKSRNSDKNNVARYGRSLFRFARLAIITFGLLTAGLTYSVRRENFLSRNFCKSREKYFSSSACTSDTKNFQSVYLRRLRKKPEFCKLMNSESMPKEWKIS